MESIASSRRAPSLCAASEAGKGVWRLVQTRQGPAIHFDEKSPNHSMTIKSRRGAASQGNLARYPSTCRNESLSLLSS